MNNRISSINYTDALHQADALFAQLTLPSVNINNIYLTEGNVGNKIATFTVKLSTQSNQTVTVNYEIDPDYAAAGGYAGIATPVSDYISKSGVLTFSPGQTQKTIAITVLGDSNIEPSEAFRVRLKSATNANIDNSSGINPLGVLSGVATIVNDDGSPPPTNFRYGEALQKSLLFYEAQRSGQLPANNHIAWRGNSALTDGSDVGRNLSGGYYDAGDHTKIGITMASALTNLAWSLVEYRNVYASGGQLDEALAALKWGTDYLLKCHVTGQNPTTRVTETKAFYGLVGVGLTADGRGEHNTWMKPEQIDSAKQQGTLYRPSFKIDAQKPGSDLAGEVAATLAAASIVFRPTNYAYAEQLLNAAKQLYTFAETYLGSHRVSIPEANNRYPDNNWSYWDELAWGSTWLYMATANNTYLNKAEQIYRDRIGGSGNWTQNYEDKSYGLGIILAAKTGKAEYRTTVENWLNKWVSGGGDGPTYTSGGLAFRNGNNPFGLASMTAFLSLMYTDTVLGSNATYSNFAKQQIDYILGKNPLKTSYMVGFGNQYPLRVHHRGAQGGNAATLYSLQPNPNILYGALVGGPTIPNDGDFTDNRRAYQPNESIFAYSGSFTGALAGLYHRYGGAPLSDTDLYKLPGLKSGSTTQSLATVEGDSLTGIASGAIPTGGEGIDALVGTSKADVFVLGDSTRAFYVEDGVKDYASIKNFNTRKDVIQLHGSIQDYELGTSLRTAKGTGIFLHTDRGNELIAIMEKTNLSNLSDAIFQFV